MQNHALQLEDIQTEILSEFAKTVEMFSFNPTESQVFATLYLNESPMTLDEMKEELGKSKTSMSTATRTLLEYNLIERVWKKGTRKDLYAAREDLYYQFMKSYVRRWLDAIDQQNSSLDRIEAKIKEMEPSDERDFIENKLKEAIAFHLALEEVFEKINDF